MQKIDIESLSFRSLRTLKLIYDLGSVSAAALELGQNQPAVSYTLDQMRTVFGDPLFVRSGRGVAPTGRCQQLMPQIEEIVRSLAELTQPEAFIPANTELDITLSLNQYELQVIAPLLIQRLNRLAPNIRIRLLQSQVNGHQQLQRGQSDLLISPLIHDYEGLYKRPLFKDRYVCLIAKSHRLSSTKISKEDYIAGKHIEIAYEGGWKPLYLSTAELQGANLNVALRSPTVSNFISTLAGTDLMLTVPERLARLMRNDEVVIKDPPFNCSFELCLYWNRITHNSRAHNWIREQIVETCKEIASSVELLPNP